MSTKEADSTFVVVQDADLDQPVRVAQALQTLNTPEARNRYKILVGFIAGLVQVRNARPALAKVVAEGKPQVTQITTQLRNAVSGTEAVIGAELPALVPELKFETSSGRKDPAQQAKEVLQVLKGNDSKVGEAAAFCLERVLHSYDKKLEHQTESEEALSQNADDAERLKLQVQLYSRECELYVHDHTPRGHAARDALKVKRTRKKKEADSTPAPSKEAPAAAPNTNSTSAR